MIVEPAAKQWSFVFFLVENKPVQKLYLTDRLGG